MRSRPTYENGTRMDGPKDGRTYPSRPPPFILYFHPQTQIRKNIFPRFYECFKNKRTYGPTFRDAWTHQKKKENIFLCKNGRTSGGKGLNDAHMTSKCCCFFRGLTIFFLFWQREKNLKAMVEPKI